VEGTAETLWQALNLPAEERKVMARYLRWTIERRDLRFWLDSQIEDLESAARAQSGQVSPLAASKIA
jgi:trehalose-6-phosphate synthase